ncbi:MAG: diacylglycerol kinase family lipid kinase [Anaerolineales bacterium]|nr:diacylglycerol kinase family lipid kinase [Anaerolineales bacterium]
MTIKIILNPYANRWEAKSQINQIETAVTAVSLSYELVVTEKPGQAIDLAFAAVEEGCDAVIAAGGDGTINEVVNGVLRAAGDGPTVPFGIIPIGTANDFSDLMGLPRDIMVCAQLLAAGKTRQIDAGCVNGRYFVNNCAVAMEPMVTIENIKMKRFSGTLRYVVALIKSLVKLKAWQMEITWEGGSYTGPTYLLSVCNGPRTGGFYMAPDAIFDDGLFDFVLAPEVPKRTVLAILLRLFNKTHIFHPAVTYARTAYLSLTSQPGTPIHADGEVFTEAETAVTFEMLPQKVTLLIP